MLPSPPVIIRPLGNVTKYREPRILMSCTYRLRQSISHVIRNGETCVIGHRLTCALLSSHCYLFSTFLIKLNEVMHMCVLKYYCFNSIKFNGFKLAIQMQEKLVRIQFLSSGGCYLLPFLFKREYPLTTIFPLKIYGREKKW